MCVRALSMYISCMCIINMGCVHVCGFMFMCVHAIIILCSEMKNHAYIHEIIVTHINYVLHSVDLAIDVLIVTACRRLQYVQWSWH